MEWALTHYYAINVSGGSIEPKYTIARIYNLPVAL